MSDSLEDLIEQIDQLIREYNTLSGYSITHRLREPAAEVDVNSLERELGFPLPSDYRAFLLLHNGWIDFEGEVALLSIAEMKSGPIVDHVRDLKHIYREEKEDTAANGIVIAASRSGSSIKFFDVSTRKPTATMDLVEWDGEEIARHGSFSQFLKFTAESWQRLIANIQEREEP